MVILLALLHALPVLAVAYATHSRGATILTAVAMIAVGVMTGSAAYIALDVLAVIIGYAIARKTLSRTDTASRVRAQIVATSSGVVSDLLTICIALVFVLGGILGTVLIYNRFFGECADAQLNRMSITFEQCRALQKRNK